MLPTRVLSPQYLFWLVVLCAAAAARRPRAALVLWCLGGPITQVIFPFRYNALRHLRVVEVGLLTVRNGLLVAAAVVLVRVLWTTRQELAEPGGDGRASPDPDDPGDPESGRSRRSRSGSSAGVAAGPDPAA
jgi:hypothetical protein